jgi:hypothetical protein
LIDSAQDENICRQLMRSDDDICCLYGGDMEIDLFDVAPYLVEINPLSPLTRWLLSSGWGKNWGIFIECDASLRSVRRHCRKFVTVYDENGRPLFFRFYDPRVLKVYLPTCHAAELQVFFGPIKRFFVEDQEGGALIEYTLAGDELARKTAQVRDLV